MRYKLNIIWAMLLSIVFSSCEDYLDQAPDSGLDESDLYNSYESMLGYLDQIFYDNNVLIYMWMHATYANGATTVGNISDEYAGIRDYNQSEPTNSGNWLANANSTFEIGCTGNTAISRAYTGLRITNRVINDIDRVQNTTDIERCKLLGQAYFLRAYFYFEVIKRYGGMPIFDTLLGAADDLDLPRKTYQESNAWMQTDLDNAIANLSQFEWTEQEHGRPSYEAALALKAMTQLYAASPLMQNDLDSIDETKGYDKTMAEAAAVTAQKAIDAVEAHSYYALMPHEDYRAIQLMPNGNLFAQPEHLWFTRFHPGNWSAFVRAQWLTQPYDDKTGGEGVPYNAPTQNMVDLFERKGEGGYYYPITDSRSGYDAVKSSDPYSDRDPRLENNIIVPGEQWGVDTEGNKYYLTTYEGGYSQYFITTQAVTTGNDQTGYMCKKFIWPEASTTMYGGSNDGFYFYRLVSVYIRVAQLYLDLAEASYEAKGDPDALVEGCKLTARQALNVIRNRAGIGDLPDGVDFREAYRRERAVELMFEGHRWYDIRRWMIAKEIFNGSYPIKGISATPHFPSGTSYTTSQLQTAAACKYDTSNWTFTYETVDVKTEVRVFDTRNYWYPLPMDEVAALDNLKQNPGW